MNIAAEHKNEKPVSTSVLFKGIEGGMTIALRVLKDQLLKEHITKIPALLVCVNGEVIFENEQGMKLTLLSGDFVNIEPMVKHWVNALSDSQLLLIK